MHNVSSKNRFLADFLKALPFAPKIAASTQRVVSKFSDVCVLVSPIYISMKINIVKKAKGEWDESLFPASIPSHVTLMYQQPSMSHLGSFIVSMMLTTTKEQTYFLMLFRSIFYVHILCMKRESFEASL